MEKLPNISEMVDFSGKRALVTGGGKGIGAAISSRLAEAGAEVTMADVDPEIHKLAEELSVSFTNCDITVPEQLKAAVQQAADGSSLDILVNNAGLMRRGTITDTTDEDYNLSMSVNVEAPFRIVRAAIPLMAAAGGGAIVNTSSCWGINPGPNHLIYCTTKAALAAMTQCLGRDHAHQNIRINAVCPSEVNTSMLRTGFEIRGLDPDAAIDELNKSVPLGHIAEPEEIANVIAFLTSDEAGYICGSLVEVNGGKAVY